MVNMEMWQSYASVDLLIQCFIQTIRALGEGFDLAGGEETVQCKSVSMLGLGGGIFPNKPG